MDLTSILIMSIFYLLCFCGIAFSIIKRRYRNLIWGFLVIILGLSLQFYGGGIISGSSPFSLLGGLLILISYGVILLGVVVLALYYEKITKKDTN